MLLGYITASIVSAAVENLVYDVATKVCLLNHFCFISSRMYVYAIFLYYAKNGFASQPVHSNRLLCTTFISCRSNKILLELYITDSTQSNRIANDVISCAYQLSVHVCFYLSETGEKKLISTCLSCLLTQFCYGTYLVFALKICRFFSFNSTSKIVLTSTIV